MCVSQNWFTRSNNVLIDIRGTLKGCGGSISKHWSPLRMPKFLWKPKKESQRSERWAVWADKAWASASHSRNCLHHFEESASEISAMRAFMRTGSHYLSLVFFQINPPPEVSTATTSSTPHTQPCCRAWRRALGGTCIILGVCVTAFPAGALPLSGVPHLSGVLFKHLFGAGVDSLPAPGAPLPLAIVSFLIPRWPGLPRWATAVSVVLKFSLPAPGSCSVPLSVFLSRPVPAVSSLAGSLPIPSILSRLPVTLLPVSPLLFCQIPVPL